MEQDRLSHGWREDLPVTFLCHCFDRLRDTNICGVKYGLFDLPQLHGELQSVEAPAEGKQPIIFSDCVHALEQFVLAKYYLTAQVYGQWHPACLHRNEGGPREAGTGLPKEFAGLPGHDSAGALVQRRHRPDHLFDSWEGGGSGNCDLAHTPDPH
jgi:hypothetical protein